MIHPSYRELMDKINEENAAENVPEITSRYSVVLATSKRARELTNGAKPLAPSKSGKALSIAVEEFYEGKVRMSPEGYSEEEAEEATEEEITAEEAEEAKAEETEEVTSDEAEEAAPEEETEAPAAEE